MTKLLYPAYLRLGGTAADQTVFMINGTEPNCTNTIPLILTGSSWTKINNFAMNTKLNFIFDFNVLLRIGKKWNSSNAKSIIKYSQSKGFAMDFQLGNEPNSFIHVFNELIRPDQLAEDYKQLRKIMNSSTLYSTSKLIGPEVTKPKAMLLPSLTYLKQFLMATHDIDVVSWHQYYMHGKTATLNDFINPETFDELSSQIRHISKVTKRYSKKPIWISETGSASGGGAPNLSDRFVASFLWLDKLGLAARMGMSVVIRHGLMNGHYALIDSELMPSPDFWISFFYKNLVGPRVLEIVKRRDDVELDHLRYYVHCSASQIMGDEQIVVFALNISNKTENVIVSGFGMLYPIYSFTFTPENSSLTSKTVYLNGKKLEYDRQSIYDLLKNPAEVKFPLVLPGYSIAFWTFHGADNCLCDRA
ncbi:hypothetical protein RUM44_003935 [Polyplax serrata]|uniref:Heparanase n=1 Tax=Polyplax serrata TaxID=468196 RepID=A0ABR1B2Z7_POLSC